jgi:hypothetical protein
LQHAWRSEQKLWSAIRGCRLGVWFRRQVVLGPFVADFVAPAALLIVEVDGAHHESDAAWRMRGAIARSPAWATACCGLTKSSSFAISPKLSGRFARRSLRHERYS